MLVESLKEKTSAQELKIKSFFLKGRTLEFGCQRLMQSSSRILLTLRITQRIVSDFIGSFALLNAWGQLDLKFQ